MGVDSLKKTLFAHGAVAVAVWSACIGLLAGLTLHLLHQGTIKAAESEARNYFELNLSYRAWAARMGGLYVPVDRATPNPYLNLSRRDRTTTLGERLTLVNPAYMTRMVFDSIKQSRSNPVVSKITSLKPLNPDNAPDGWESEALRAFERGEREPRSQVTLLNGEPYLRFIALFATEQACLDCHGHQGYRVGDVRGGITIAIPMRSLYAKEGEQRNNLVAGYLLLWGMGSTGIVLSARRRSAYQEQLHDSQENFRTICDWTQDWEYWVDPKGGMRYVSPSCLEHTGYPQADFLKDPDLVARLVHSEDQPLYARHLEVMRGDEPQRPDSVEFRIRTREGALRWMHQVSRPVFTQGGYQGHRVSTRDVTDRKSAEQSLQQAVAALRENEGKLRVLFDVMQAGIIQVDRDEVVTFANQRMAEMLGLPMEELLGSAYSCHVHPDQRGEALLSLRRLLDGTQPSTNLERHYRRKDGSDFWGYLSGRRLDSPDGNSLCVVATITDLSGLKSAQEERLKSEQQMLHVQKLESLGVLAGGIAHDFNNILLAIMGNVSLALYKTPAGSAVEHHLHQIELAADKAADLSRQMLAYSGKGRFILEALDLNLLVREMTSILEVSITKKAALQFNLAPGLPNIVADPTQIRQIVMNLAINASEAIGERSGTISITTGSRFCDQCYLAGISAGEELAEGVFVFLEVADDGCGMDRDTLQRIFEPFFTTKFTGRGLGMSAIQGIVRGHKGAVQVSSEPGRGSSFRIYLPASDQAVASCLKGAELGQWQGAGTVLLVDDEEPVRAVASEMLRQLGFEVVCAVDGQDALRLYREDPERIELVLMDLNMPQLGGEETFHELRRINAAVRVVLSSGFSEQEVTRKFLGQGLAGFLQKPYTLESLKETLSMLF